ncbi:unnamed protein product [Camellia sinensis]
MLQREAQLRKCLNSWEMSLLQNLMWWMLALIVNALKQKFLTQPILLQNIKVASALVPKGREATEVDQVNLFDDHEQNSEFHVHQGGLSSGVEGREATEVDQVDLFNDHEQNSESHVHQGGLSSGAEGREATEVDQVDLFDDHGLTVSSLVSIDCNEDRGNGPASLDKSFGEDKYVAKEKVVGGMMDKRINM